MLTVSEQCHVTDAISGAGHAHCFGTVNMSGCH